jgi:hypothetical protein
MEDFLKQLGALKFGIKLENYMANERGTLTPQGITFLDLNGGFGALSNFHHCKATDGPSR